MKPSHLSSVTFVTGGAAPFGPALIEQFMEKVIFIDKKKREKGGNVGVTREKREKRGNTGSSRK